MNLPWDNSVFPPFVRCLGSLPNLHTLGMGRMDDFNTTSLKDALGGVKLPQIKSLVLPPPAHPLLRHCRDVEDVVCIVRYKTTSPNGFLRSLESNDRSKVKRLAIPLVIWANPSRK